MDINIKPFCFADHSAVYQSDSASVTKSLRAHWFQVGHYHRVIACIAVVAVLIYFAVMLALSSVSKLFFADEHDF